MCSDMGGPSDDASTAWPYRTRVNRKCNFMSRAAPAAQRAAAEPHLYNRVWAGLGAGVEDGLDECTHGHQRGSQMKTAGIPTDGIPAGKEPVWVYPRIRHAGNEKPVGGPAHVR